MVKCPKCKSDDYDVVYLDDYTYKGNEICVLVRAKCCECNHEFWVTEHFIFKSAENTI